MAKPTELDGPATGKTGRCKLSLVLAERAAAPGLAEGIKSVGTVNDCDNNRAALAADAGSKEPLRRESRRLNREVLVAMGLSDELQVLFK